MKIDRTARLIIGNINKQFGKAAKIKEDVYLLKPFKTLSEDEKTLARIQHKGIFAQMEAMPNLIHGMGDLVFEGEKFALKKDKLIQFAVSMGDKGLETKLAKVKDREGLYNICNKYCFKLLKSCEEEARRLVAGTKGKITLELEQTIEQMRVDRYNKMRGLYEALANKSVNPRVIEIENILKTEYGMKTVNLEDDLPRAEQILRVVKGLKVKGFPIPDNVIVSDLHCATGELCKIGGEKTMFLQSTRYQVASTIAGADPEILKYFYRFLSPKEFTIYQKSLQTALSKGISQMSTAMEDHIVTHECLHGNHTSLLAFFHKALPSKFKKTAKEISLYTNINTNTAEILTELESKLHLTGMLTLEEMELYKYIKQFQIYA
ncbi:hypothetical protein IKQ21_02625 [bacterium]|nr:hypothetical protein [bacterium]